MSNSLLVLQSEHTELLKCVRTTSTVLCGVASALRTRPAGEARGVALGKLRHVCRSLEALAGLASQTQLPDADLNELEYDDEVHMDRALEGFSGGCAAERVLHCSCGGSAARVLRRSYGGLAACLLLCR
jgi:hypothetical protein